MKSVVSVLKENLVLVLAVVAASVSMLAVPPSASYAGYINVPVLAILFCLMVVIGGLRESGVFAAVLARLLLRLGTMRQLAAVLVFACFFVSMWVTNDVALLTFVPFSLMALPKVASEKQMALVIVLQTLAANLGSMCTPVGNPQNLYLYFYYTMDLSSFLLLLLPYTLVSFLLLALSLFRLPGTPIPISVRLAARRTRNLPVLAPLRHWAGCFSFPCSLWRMCSTIVWPWPWSWSSRPWRGPSISVMLITGFWVPLWPFSSS